MGGGVGFLLRVVMILAVVNYWSRATDEFGFNIVLIRNLR